jgi:hypothetical protein
MTGPPYPHPNPVPGSNAIGSFTIGVSPIGTISPWDPWKTVLSQYANSPILSSLILSQNAAMDQTENYDNLYDDIWNVDSAQGYGLDVLGRIVGVQRALQLPGEAEYFGFQEAGSWSGFGGGGGGGIFYSGGQITSNFNLPDDTFRSVILAKAATNIWDGSIPAWNQILLDLFPGQISYVQNNQNMSVTLVFKFVLSLIQTAIVGSSGALPNPTGIVINIEQNPT